MKSRLHTRRLVVLTLLVSSALAPLAGCADNSAPSDDNERSDATVPRVSSLTLKQAENAAITARDVGVGARDYDYADPILAGCLSEIEDPIGKFSAQLEGQWSYMTAGDPVSVDEYIASYPEDMKVASLLMEIGVGIKKCRRVDFSQRRVSIRMDIRESRSAGDLDVDGEQGFVAIGQIGTPGRLDPIEMRVTYLLVGPNIVRVTTKSLARVADYHKKMVAVAYKRIKASATDH